MQDGLDPENPDRLELRRGDVRTAPTRPSRIIAAGYALPLCPDLTARDAALRTSVLPSGPRRRCRDGNRDQPFGVVRSAPACGHLFFNSGLILASNSSNDMVPLTLSPLTKKVGVALTWSTSKAK